MKAMRFVAAGVGLGLLAALALSPQAQTRVTSGVRQYIGVMPADKCHQDALGACQMWSGGTTTYYTTTGSKQVYGGAGGVVNVMSTGGSSVTVQFFDDADGTCDTGAKGGIISLTADAQPMVLNWEFTNGICMLVAGTSPEVTVVTLP
jgi:hypothetical protein